MHNMNYFVPNETYDKAIQNKEKGVLRALLIGIVGSDPTFATTEYEEANTYVESKSQIFNNAVLNLNEDFQKQEGEYQETAERWNEEYYQMLLVWYRDNYASERLPVIKEVGQEVYKNKPTLGKSKRQNRNTPQQITKSQISRNNQVHTKDTVVRSTGNDVRKERLTAMDWIKKNWYVLALLAGAGVAVIYMLFFRK